MDARLPQPNSALPERCPQPKRSWIPPLVLAAGLVGTLAGCSLFLYANKMLFGDPMVDCAFRRTTKVDLTNGEKSVIVLCTVPTAVSSEYSAVHMDILERVTLQLKRVGIRVVNANKVLTLLDDHAGRIDKDELAAAFKADYIIHIDLSAFTHRAENSPQLYQGKTNGNILVYEITEVDEKKTTTEVFRSEFQSVYPEHNPIPADQMSAKVFKGDYLARISKQIAQFFHDYPVSDTVY